MPERLSNLKRRLARQGIVVAPAGRHFKAAGVNAQGERRTYSIPAHNGDKTELSDVYIRGLARTFGLDVRTLYDDIDPAKLEPTTTEASPAGGSPPSKR
jgi:hypothetical protein